MIAPIDEFGWRQHGAGGEVHGVMHGRDFLGPLSSMCDRLHCAKHGMPVSWFFSHRGQWDLGSEEDSIGRVVRILGLHSLDKSFGIRRSHLYQTVVWHLYHSVWCHRRLYNFWVIIRAIVTIMILSRVLQLRLSASPHVWSTHMRPLFYYFLIPSRNSVSNLFFQTIFR